MTSASPAPFSPATHTLPTASVSVVVLAKDEATNITRCLATLSWAGQVIVLDSGSSDQTRELARAGGADVVETHWRGFGAQRELALRLPQLKFDWVFFVDADEWVSVDLAREVAMAVQSNDFVGYWFYKRLIFQGRWIRHCGWYPSARVVALMRRDRAHFEPYVFSEHPTIEGPVGRLRSDIIDEDMKGLSSWMTKHVKYAELEAERRVTSTVASRRQAHEARIRFWLKGRLAQSLPARPLVQFVYMYVMRGGFRDGREGFSFCFYHAWFQMLVADHERRLRAER